MTDDLRAAIAGLPPGARDKLRRILVMDPTDRDEVAKELLRFRDEAGLSLARETGEHLPLGRTEAAVGT